MNTSGKLPDSLAHVQFLILKKNEKSYHIFVPGLVMFVCFLYGRVTSNHKICRDRWAKRYHSAAEAISGIELILLFSGSETHPVSFPDFFIVAAVVHWV